MKSIRIFGALTFLIGTLYMNVIPASATSSSETVGYIRLVSDDAVDFANGQDINFPVAMLAEETFVRLYPKLKAAQARGDILDFQPVLGSGILLVKYRRGANLEGSLNGVQLFPNAQDALSPIVTTQQASQVSTRATYDPRFYMDLYSSCFGGYGLLPDGRVVASLLNQSGVRLAVQAVAVDTTGNMYGCFEEFTYNKITPGFKIVFKVYRSTGTLRSTYSNTVPMVKISSYAKSTSKISYVGPAGRVFGASWFHQNQDKTGSVLSSFKTGTIPAGGKGTVDMGTVPFKGADSLGFYAVVGRFRYSRNMSVPYVWCSLGDNSCNIFGLAFQKLNFSVMRAGITYTFSGKTDSYGVLSLTLENANGVPIILKNGDKVSGTNVAVYTLPRLTAAMDYVTNMVSGKAPKSSYFSLYVIEPLTNSWYGYRAHSNIYGNYFQDFTTVVDLQDTKAYYVEIRYRDKNLGNTVDVHIPFGP